MITVTWDNPENTVIRQDFSGEFVSREMEATGQQIIAMLDSASHPVTLIMALGSDMRVSADVISLFPRWARAPMMTHPNLSAIIIVGARGFAATMIDVFVRVYPAQTMQVSQSPSLEDARLKISARRMTP